MNFEISQNCARGQSANGNVLLCSVFDTNHNNKLDSGDAQFSSFRIVLVKAAPMTSVQTLADAGIDLAPDKTDGFLKGELKTIRYALPEAGRIMTNCGGMKYFGFLAVSNWVNMNFECLIKFLKFVAILSLFASVLNISRLSAQELSRSADIEARFNDVLRQVGQMRVRDRSADLVFSYLFDPIVKQYSFEFLCGYFEKRFKLDRFSDADGNIALITFQGRDLRNLEVRFSGKDKMLLGCRYSDDWKTATRVVARIFYVPLEF